MKTNKSYLKRVRVTKNGKLITRRPGQNHFNSKKTGNERMADKRPSSIKMSSKDKGRYLPNT